HLFSSHDPQRAQVTKRYYAGTGAALDASRLVQSGTQPREEASRTPLDGVFEPSAQNFTMLTHLLNQNPRPSVGSFLQHLCRKSLQVHFIRDLARDLASRPLYSVDSSVIPYCQE